MINDMQSQLSGYLDTTLTDFNQLYKIADVKKTSMPLERISIALDSTMPNCELLIVAIGQQHNEKFKLKYTLSRAFLETSVLSAEEVMEKICKEKVKEMRLELVKHAYYDLFNISIYLNDDIIGSLVTENTDIDSEIRWIYG